MLPSSPVARSRSPFADSATSVTAPLSWRATIRRPPSVRAATVPSARPSATTVLSRDTATEVIALGPAASSRRTGSAPSDHVRAVPSSLAVSAQRPSVPNATPVTRPRCPRNCDCGAPVRAFQTRAVPSRLAVSTWRPSGLNVTASTKLVWPMSCRRSRPVSASQTRAVPSVLAVASRLPSSA